MTSKDDYWIAVRVKFNELIEDFKERYEDSTDPEYLYDIRLGELEELWSFSNWILYRDVDGPVYDGGHLRFARNELVAGKRDYDDSDHLELDAYLQFEKWLSGEPTRWSKNTNDKIQKLTAKNTDQTRVSNNATSKQVLGVVDSQTFNELVNAVENASSSAERGKSLEELVSKLFETIPGLTVSDRNLRTETEEIDIAVINGSNDPRFRREEAILLVECKNWNDKCDKNEFVLFKQKIENRSGRCSVGFLISWNGFKNTINKEMLRGSRERTLIVPMTGENIRAAICNNNFFDMLFTCWHEALNT